METTNLLDTVEEKLEEININSYSDMINKKWFFRTVTYHMVGKVTKIINDFIQLEDASWIADSGRFSNFIKEGIAAEVEPVGTCFINLKTVVDIFPWVHELPKEQK